MQARGVVAFERMHVEIPMLRTRTCDSCAHAASRLARVEFAPGIRLPALKKRDVDGTENAALRASFLLIFRSQIHSAAELKNETVRVRRAGGLCFSVLRQSQLFGMPGLPGPRPN